jgi:signal transduction histidine kinase
MRRLITLLVAAITSVVILAFLVPLALLIRAETEDGAIDRAKQQAQGVSALVAGVDDRAELDDLIRRISTGSNLTTRVWLPDGSTAGATTDPTASDPLAASRVEQARRTGAFTAVDHDRGARLYQSVAGPRGTIVVSTFIPAAIFHDGLAKSWVVLALVGVGLLATALVAADRMGRRVAAPITEVSLVAHRLRTGELTARATVRGPAEVRDLASSVNRLAERIGELLRIEREAIADLSHRLRTPTTALRLDAESVTEPHIRARLSTHVEQLQRTIDAIVRDARRPMAEIEQRHCDASAVTAERASFWSALAADQGRQVLCEIAPGPMPVAISAIELADILDVLLDNVFTHTEEGVGLEIALNYDSAGSVRLEVIDRGAGPDTTKDPADALDWLERGVSSRSGSSGLGLDIVRRAARAAGGELVLRRGVTGGTVAMVTLAPA